MAEGPWNAPFIYGYGADVKKSLRKTVANDLWLGSGSVGDFDSLAWQGFQFSRQFNVPFTHMSPALD